MDSYSVVDDWDVTRFDGGFGGLAELSSRGFNGAVEADGTWVFLRDGDPLTVVSDLRSTPTPAGIDALEATDGQRHDAPTAGAATLAAMLALDGEVRGRYFTDDTPLEAVHGTLSEGGFTGYVELSENVLSGDYYFVYVDGEVEHIGFVGTSPMISGEEAESKAKSEVGIYAVVAVRFPEIELPTPAPEPDGDEAGIDEPESEANEAEFEADEPEELETDEPEEFEADEPEEFETGSEPNTGTRAEAEAEPEPEKTSEPEPEPELVTEAEPKRAERAKAGERTSPERIADDGSSEPRSVENDDERPADDRSTGSPGPGYLREPSSEEGTDRQTDDAAAHERPATESRDDAAAAAREARGGHETGGIEAVTVRTVPSLDPENSSQTEAKPKTASTSATGGRAGDTTHGREQESESTVGGSSERPPAIERLREEYESRISEYESQIADLESQIGDLESQIGDLESRLADSDARIEELESELASVRSERDKLENRIDAADDSPASRSSLSPTEALGATSLFVREVSRGEATLADARDSGVDRETVTSNLRIEHHTNFEEDGAIVEGKPFESWLRSSDTYAFVKWLVIDLFFEIRSTGTADGLKPLYEALPEIDRISFEDSIAVGNGTEGREVSFDIVARDKKGNPLVVAKFDRQRDPTRAEAIEPFVTDASDVCEESESLAGAVAVTSSYFESDAMAATEEATGTSLLSRSKYRSYVKLSRTSGYHLCLVEARDESFNLTVPEL